MQHLKPRHVPMHRVAGRRFRRLFGYHSARLAAPVGPWRTIPLDWPPQSVRGVPLRSAGRPSRSVAVSRPVSVYQYRYPCHTHSRVNICRLPRSGRATLPCAGTRHAVKLTRYRPPGPGIGLQKRPPLAGALTLKCLNCIYFYEHRVEIDCAI